MVLTAQMAFVGASENLDIQHGRAAPGGAGLATVQGAAPTPDGELTVGLQSLYVSRPLVLVNAANQVTASVVSGQLALVPTALWGLRGNFSVAASWLLAPYQGLNARYNGQGFVRDVRVAPGVGDLWLQGRWAFLQQSGGWLNAALAPSLRVPSYVGSYLSDGGFSFVPEVQLDRTTGPWYVAANLGAVLRLPVKAAGFALGQQFLWRAGAGYSLDRINLPQVQVTAEAFGLAGEQSPAEWLVGGRFRWGDLSFYAGGGGGLWGGYGAAQARGNLGITWVVAAGEAAAVDTPGVGGAISDPNAPDGPTRDPNASDPQGADPNTADPNGLGDPNARDPNTLDSDADGIVDAKDKCPLQPETINNFEDEDGCPDQGKPTLVTVKERRIELRGKVFFGIGSAVLMPRAFEVLNQLASVLKNHSNMHVRLTGHTDHVGGKEVNHRLALARAQAVQKYLVEHGIEASRLSLGSTEPDDNGEGSSPRAMALSRRVTVEITSGGAPLMVPTQ